MTNGVMATMYFRPSGNNDWRRHLELVLDRVRVPAAERATVLDEARRVLAPGGSLHLVDFRTVSVDATLVERRRSLAYYALRT